AMDNPKESFAFALTPFDEFGHRFPATLDDARVSVHLVNRPRTNHARITPAGAEIPAVLEGKRRVAWKSPAGPLRVHQLADPFGVKSCRVGIVGCRPNIDLRIAGPAKALVALGAVGGQIDEIGALSPNDVFEKAIYHRIRAFEIAGQRRVRMHDDAGDGIEIRFARIAGQLDV